MSLANMPGVKKKKKATLMRVKQEDETSECGERETHFYCRLLRTPGTSWRTTFALHCLTTCCVLERLGWEEEHKNTLTHTRTKNKATS